VPWFQEIEIGRALARMYENAPRLSYFQGITERSPDELLQSFADGPRIDDPRYGRIETKDDFRRYVNDVRRWLSQQNGIRPVALTLTRERSVEEVTISPKNERAELPVAIVTELADDGRLSAVRLYYGLWPSADETQPYSTDSHVGSPPPSL
jgi:hypothetical protein